MSTKPKKKRKPTDATLRNVRAANDKFAKVHAGIDNLDQRLCAVEKALRGEATYQTPPTEMTPHGR